MRLIKLEVFLVAAIFAIMGCGAAHSTYLYKQNVTNAQISKDAKDCKVQSLTNFQGNNQQVKSISDAAIRDRNNDKARASWMYGCMYQKGYEHYTEEWLTKNVKNWDKAFYNKQQSGFLHVVIYDIDKKHYEDLGGYHE
jgi:hypothetical protein